MRRTSGTDYELVQIDYDLGGLLAHSSGRHQGRCHASGDRCHPLGSGFTHQEFVLFYQAVMDTETETVVGLALGKSMGLEVIAEGVESAEALEYLRTRQCERSQGFHFCRPMPAVKFEQWCRGRLGLPSVNAH